MTPRRLPAVDDRLVDPEMNIEMIDGEVFPVSPAREPHGDRHSKLSSLLEACVAEGFNVAVDMLTRTDESSDVAPDASVYPRARDPETGGRQLEHLAFEVVSRQTLAYAGRKAQTLSRRGVRRVFAIDVERARVLEWSAAAEAWLPLSDGALIEDDALAVPLGIDDLATCASSCDAVARMLLARNNAVLDAALAEREQRGRHLGRRQGQRRGQRQGHQRGHQEGLRTSIVAVLVARGLSLSDEHRRIIESTTDLDLLARWVAQAATCESTAELLAEHRVVDDS